MLQKAFIGLPSLRKLLAVLFTILFEYDNVHKDLEFFYPMLDWLDLRRVLNEFFVISNLLM